MRRKSSVVLGCVDQRQLSPKEFDTLQPAPPSAVRPTSHPDGDSEELSRLDARTRVRSPDSSSGLARKRVRMTMSSYDLLQGSCEHGYGLLAWGCESPPPSGTHCDARPRFVVGARRQRHSWWAPQTAWRPSTISTAWRRSGCGFHHFPFDLLQVFYEHTFIHYLSPPQASFPSSSVLTIPAVCGSSPPSSQFSLVLFLLFGRYTSDGPDAQMVPSSSSPFQ